MLTYEDCVAFSGNKDFSVAAPFKHAEHTEYDDCAEHGNNDDPGASLRAPARLVALSLLADGRMDPCEVSVLCHQKGLGRLGLSQKDFFQELYEFCADVSRMPASGASYVISREHLLGLLGEVTDPALREKTLSLMIDVIRSDGNLDRGEATLLRTTLDAWNMDVRQSDPRAAAQVATA